MPVFFNKNPFDKHFSLYEEMVSWPYRKKLEIPMLATLLGNLTGLNIVDFGCGPGVFSRWLADQGAEKVVDYDISEGMLNYARHREKKALQGISYCSSLAADLTEKFDIVLAIYVMPYAQNKEKLLAMSQEMVRLLKPGGRIITLPIHPDFHPDPEYYRPYGLQLIERTPRADGSPIELNICYPPYNVDIQAYYWSAETLENTLRQVGFHLITWPELQPSLSILESDGDLRNYLNRPHAAFIEGRKRSIC